MSNLAEESASNKNESPKFTNQAQIEGSMSKCSSSVTCGAKLAALLLALAVPAWTQTRSAYDRSTAIEQSSSRAQNAADDLVSLSAEKIISLLREETGLLLEVKRLLVRKAYEQGRLLDPADLTDDALFQLLREDDNIRVLATLEIERREYVRPKPTRQEMAKGRIERLPAPEPSKASGSGAVAPAQSEEEKYWAQHELPGAPEPGIAPRASVVNDGFSSGGFAEPDPAAPPQDASPAQPTAPPYPDIRRRQSLAGVQPLGRD